MSSAYHPQSDGQTEIFNKVLQQDLRCFVSEQPSHWGKFLHLAEWHYNTLIHTSPSFSPFVVVFWETSFITTVNCWKFPSTGFGDDPPNTRPDTAVTQEKT